jgi:NitT/TauT family transport system ATP-binding protein
MSSPKLQARGVGRTYQLSGNPLVVLSDFNLDVTEGEFVALLGPSGCGKSTILNIIAGLDTASVGELTLGGQALRGPGMDRGVVLQSYALFPWLSVLDNLCFPLRILKWPRSRQMEAAREFLAVTGLEKFAEALPGHLSGGMRQRVAIARALIFKPQLLLMDEPFGALDALTRAGMQNLLLKIWMAERTTVLFVTHDIDEAIFLSDRVVVMQGRPGCVIEDIRIDLPRPRERRMTLETEFLRLKARMLTLLGHQE